ncbi:hypothetical protein O0L34_g12799 [Tuta absoluta]|nr:hypothetical protein O0L34_g12799 [Tuta absoluta]
MLSRFHPNNTELKTFMISHVCKHKGILKHSRIEYLNGLLSTTSDGGSGRALWGVIRSETNKCMEVSGDPFAVLRRAVCGDVAGAGAGSRLADSLNDYYLSVVRDTPLRPSVPDAIALLAAAVPRVKGRLVLKSRHLRPSARRVEKIARASLR